MENNNQIQELELNLQVQSQEASGAIPVLPVEQSIQYLQKDLFSEIVENPHPSQHTRILNSNTILITLYKVSAHVIDCRPSGQRVSMNTCKAF